MEIAKTLDTISQEAFIGDINDQKTVKALNVLLELSTMLTLQDKMLIIQGGFAADLAIGHLTRPHDDLDVIVLKTEFGSIKEIVTPYFDTIGTHEGFSPENTFTAARLDKELGGNIDVDCDTITIHNEEVSDGDDEEFWVWPFKASELLWQRTIGDTSVIFLNPKIVYKFKKLQQLKSTVREKDQIDFDNLLKAFPDIES